MRNPSPQMPDEAPSLAELDVHQETHRLGDVAALSRGFGALATLCGGAGASAALPLSPELNVRVARC